MAEARKSIHGEWSSRFVFILAATGSAVGLGNIWKFPYVAGENGGGAFVLMYLLCVAVIGIPVMMAEILIGRRGRQSPIHTMRTLARSAGQSSNWQWLGWMGVLAGFLILSYYSVIAGWAMAYVEQAASGAFVDKSPKQIGAVFSALTGSPGRLMVWHTLFMLLTMFVVARGVKKGLEQAVRYLMPALFVLLIILVGYAMATADFVAGFKFLFAPDFSKLSWNAVLIAMGHAFFTLSLGMGAIMIYGSYLPKGVSIATTSITIAIIDTLVALLAGLIIFPIVFANGLDAGEGPGLVFVTLPIAFGHMPGGLFFGTLFFVLLSLAAWTSAISVIEPTIAWMVERFNVSRVKASVWAGGLTWLIGIGSVLSFNIWSKPLAFGKTFFDLLEYLTANIMLPLGGLMIAVFAAWLMSKQSTQDELQMDDNLGYKSWRFLVRFVTPVAVIVIFLNATGIINILIKLR